MDIEKLLPENYPKQLLQIPHPPEELWIRGNLPPSETKMLVVVGSRALTRYGREACEILIRGLAGYPISIISGLALGADACAHETALQAGLHTIAIPGSGLGDEYIGPRSNLSLAHRILEKGGALLSEHPPEYLAYRHDFPSRNRIMVGIADAVLIIEAGPNSGTLITASLAGEYNRHLLCVPHRIGDPHGFGAHTFMRIGATQVTSSLHILEALHIMPREDDPALVKNMSNILASLTQSEQEIYRVLETPCSTDELIRELHASTGEVLTLLVSLEFKGIITEEFGVWKRV